MKRLWLSLLFAYGGWVSAQTPSQPVPTTPVFSDPVAIDAAEYFWDNDPGAGSGTAIAGNYSEGNYNLTDLQIDVSSVSPGIHHLYIRVRDVNGNWGIAQKYPVFIPATTAGTPETITSAEYFFDEVGAEGSGTSVNITDNITEQIISDISIDVGSRPGGFNTFYIRSRDANGWGIPQRYSLYLTPQSSASEITAAEYSIDEVVDPGSGTAVNVNNLVVEGENASINDLSISMSGLQPGFHRLFLRFQTADGQWTANSITPFYLSPDAQATAALVTAEYSIDENVNEGEGTEVTVIFEDGTGRVQDESIDLAGVDPGFHNLYFRFQDSEGLWTGTRTTSFFLNPPATAQPTLSAAEYFFGGSDAPAAGSGDAMIAKDGSIDSNSDTLLALARVPAGAGSKSVYVRTQTDDGTWGIPFPYTFSATDQSRVEGQIYVEISGSQELRNGVVVNLYQGGDVVQTDTTEAFGFYAFANLNPGTYEVEASIGRDPQSGVSISSGRVQVSPGNAPDVVTQDLNVRLPLVINNVTPFSSTSTFASTGTIRVTYSDSLIESSVDAETIILESRTRGRVPVNVALEDGNRTVAIQANGPLYAGEKMTLRIPAGFQNLQGDESLPYEKSFNVAVTGGQLSYTSSQVEDFAYTAPSGFAYTSPGLEVFDVNGDSYPDAVTIASYTTSSDSYNSVDTLIVALNDRSGNLSDISKLAILENEFADGFTNSPRQLLSTDWDYDGDVDLLLHVVAINTSVSPTQYLSRIILYTNTGSGVFLKAESIDISDTFSEQVIDISLGDIDHDGRVDIVYPFYTVNPSNFSITGVDVYAVPNTNFGSFPAGTVRVLEKVAPLNINLAVGDVTNDGISDIVLALYNDGGGVYVYRGNSSGIEQSIGPVTSFNPVGFNYHTAAEIIDLGNDGKLDFVSWMPGRGNLRVYTNYGSTNSDTVFTETIDVYSSGSDLVGANTDPFNASLDIGNIDNFAQNELLFTRRTGIQILGYPSPTANSIESRAAITPPLAINGYEMENPVFADLDRDGDMDFVTLAGSFISTSFPSRYRNLTMATFLNADENTNNAPTLVNATQFQQRQDFDLGDISSLEFGLLQYFDDPDDDDLFFSASSSNTNVATTLIQNDSLFVTVEGAGTTSIVVTASDGKGGSVQNGFTLSITDPNNGTPSFSTAISDTTVTEDQESIVIDLTDIVSDPEEDEITLSAISSNESVITVSVNQLRIFANIQGVGTATITATISDGNTTADEQFDIIVNPFVDPAPTIVSTIEDQIMATTDAQRQFSLGDYFDDNLPLTYDVISSNESVVVAGLSGGGEVLDQMILTPFGSGSATVTVTASDQVQQTVFFVFNVSVGVRPAIIGRPVSTVLLENQTYFYDRDELFEDEDSGVNNLNWTIRNYNPTSAILTSPIGQNFRVQTLSPGTARISIIGTDELNLVSDSLVIDFDVREINTETGDIQTTVAGSAFPSGLVVQKWALLSIPGRSDRTLTPQQIFENLGGDFKLFDLESLGDDREQYQFIEVTDDLDNPFEVGKSLWFKTLAQDQNFVFSAPAGTRESSRSYLISNPGGWQFVANPYDFAVEFTTSGTIFIYEYNYNQERWEQLNPASDVLRPFGGYAAFTPATGAIRIDLNGVDPLFKPAAKEERAEPAWSIDIRIDEQVLRVGEQDEAVSGFDALDRPLPPPPPDSEPVAFINIDRVPSTVDFREPGADQTESVLNYRDIFIPKGSHSIALEAAGQANEDWVMLIAGDQVHRKIYLGDAQDFAAIEDRTYKVYFGPESLVDQVVVPAEVTLYPAFPNPFNPTTSLRFAVPEEANVELKVFDVLGREVATLVNGTRTEGIYNASFNARGLASGVYLYRLRVGDAVQVRKMTLIK